MYLETTLLPHDEDEEFESTEPSRYSTGKSAFYSKSEIVRMGSRLAKKLRIQEEWDDRFAPSFAPNLFDGSDERFPTEGERGSYHRFRLRAKIASTATAVIYRVDFRDDMVVKYQVGLKDRASFDVHPLFRDALFLGELKDTNFVPRAEYISPPSLMIEEWSEKTDFTMIQGEREDAVIEGATVRFMIMQRIDMDMYQRINRFGHYSVFKSLELLKDLIKGLSVVHARGIVHGDIHPGNVGFINNRIVIFDFGTAFYAEEQKYASLYVREPFSYIHSLFSHWNLEGVRFGYRDDVFKAILVIAFAMNGNGWLKYSQELETNGHAMFQFKAESFLFEYPRGDRFEARFRGVKSPTVTSQVRMHLAKILEIARAPTHPDSLPDYQGIIAEIDKAVTALL
jgi:hypothetical protein